MAGVAADEHGLPPGVLAASGQGRHRGAVERAGVVATTVPVWPSDGAGKDGPVSVDPPPPDRPTRRLPPTPAVEQERVLEVRDPGLLERLEESVRSLRTAVALVGLLAAAALGVAIYALMEADEDSRGGASRERVSRLDDRVDRLSRQLQSTRSSNRGDAEEGELESLRTRLENTASAEDVERLESSLRELQGRADDDPADSAALEERVDRLARQVEQLRTQSP